tara:strand:+ start:5600 stop:6058 length:459 start_codon:yes stop_codon:yes gene_type:complete
MAKLLNIPRNQTGYYVLALLLCLFIIFPIAIPGELAKLIDTIIGKIVIAIVVLNLFISHPLVGSIGAVAAYELLRRSAKQSHKYVGVNKKNIPSEKQKTGNLTSFNQFPVTVEEIVINNKIPYSFNVDAQSQTKTPFSPLEEDTYNASKLNH